MGDERDTPNAGESPVTDFVWRMAGGSGDGQITTGQNFAKALMRSGLDVFTHQHYTSRIRGGHIYVEVRAADHAVKSRGDGFDFLVALGDSFARNPKEDAVYGNEEVKPLTENLDDLREGGVIVYDEGLLDTEDVPDFEERVEANDWHVYPLDLRGLAKEHGREVMRNTAGVGATAALVGMDLDDVEDLIEESMAGDTAEANLAVLRDAHDHVAGMEHTHDIELPAGSHDETPVMVSGSHAVAYGAIDAGCRFVSGYPMTPWTDVFTIMSQLLPEMGGVSEQVEDEIAAAAMGVGASHAGAKALTGSSGGGFALMSEPLGLAEMSETPLVFVEAMRAGPSTGMPTKPEQADLEHVLYTSQGDSHRVVLAPSNATEAYEQTRQAFEIAYGYQLPVVVLVDQKLTAELRSLPASVFDQEPEPGLGSTLTEAEIEAELESLEEPFRRFAHDAEDGVSSRSLPGQKGGRFLATGNEHGETGHISEDPDNRVAQVERRGRKLAAIRDDLADGDANQSHHGPADARYGILTWGTQRGAVEEAVDLLQDDGWSVRALNVSDLAPFPREEVAAFLAGVETALVVELSSSAQFRRLVQSELGRYGGKLTSLLKYDGTPFEPAEVADGFEAVVAEADLTAERTRLEPAGGD